jgi:AraC family transcriptional regulator
MKSEWRGSFHASQFNMARDDAATKTEVFGTGGQTMDVEIKDMPEIRAAGIRHTGPYNQIGLAFDRLGKIAGPAGLFSQPDATMIGIYHDNPQIVAKDQLRSDAAVTLADGMPLPAGLQEQRIPAGRYATTTHVGPYEELPDVWARLVGEWLPASGNRIGPGASYEIYRNDPTKVAKQELITELYVSVL